MQHDKTDKTLIQAFILSMINVSRIINSFFSSNTFIITSLDEKSVWLIDCGDADKIIETIDSNGWLLKGVCLTHVHYDHIYGLNDLRDRYGEFTVYTNRNGKENLLNPRYNFSKFHESEFIYQGKDIQLINNGDDIKLFDNTNVKAVETPGHDWSCLTFKIGDFLFTGDSYIPNLKTVTSFPKSNKVEAKRSEQIILSLCNEQTIICPGHGPITENRD